MSDVAVSADSHRYKIIIKTHICVAIGYLFVSIETFIARMIGLTAIPYFDIAVISLVVICGTLLFLLFIRLQKSLSRKLERILFTGQVILYVILFSAWVYRLNDMRLFALFSSLFAILIVLSYTNLVQSLIVSVSTIISYIAISYYNIHRINSGNFKQDLFYALCFIPTIVFVSIIANQITKKNKELEVSKMHLEEINDKLLLLNREMKHSQKMSKIELDLAQDIQKSLFPERPPVTQDWDIALSFKPRFGVSGDFYDFYYEDGFFRGLSLFDVSGHGVASALITILAKPIFSNYFNKMKTDPLNRLFEVANYTLRKDLNETNMYITGIMLRCKNSEIEYINAGHPDPLYKSKKSGNVISLSDSLPKSKTNPIGLMDTIASCTSAKFSPGTGDVLLLFTDCLTESKNFKNSRYGYDRLIQSLEEAPDGSAEEILEYLLKRFNSFLNEKEIEDDFTVILFKKK